MSANHRFVPVTCVEGTGGCSSIEIVAGWSEAATEQKILAHRPWMFRRLGSLAFESLLENR